VNCGKEAEPVWKLISDCNLGVFLRQVDSHGKRKKRLAMTLETAVEEGISLIDSHIRYTNDTVQDVIKRCQHHAVLIVSTDKKQLVGIVTPFDLL